MIVYAQGTLGAISLQMCIPNLTQISLAYSCTYIHMMFLHTYMHTYIRTYIHTYIHTYSTAQRQRRKCSQFIRVITSSFVLIESASGMRISLDYQPIEVNTDVTTESYTTECNCKDKATRIRNFVVSQA